MIKRIEGDERTELLVVDDSADDRKLYRRLLMQAFPAMLSIHECSTAREALERCRRAKPDCVLLDDPLPDQDGLEVLSALRGEDGELVAPVILLTGEGNEEIAARAIRLGAHDYLLKSNLSPQVLALAISGAKARYAAAAEQRRRYEELRYLAFSAAHDLKAPLRKVNSLAQIVRDHFSDIGATEAEDALERIERSLAQMREMVDGLLAFANAEATPNSDSEVCLARVLGEVLQNLAGTGAIAAGEVVVEDMPLVRGEATPLVQVFQNLISNGLKFNRSERPRVQVTATIQEGSPVITVSDNGIGMEPEHLKAILSPLHRLHGRAELAGTGLGLATCKRIVEHLGGRLACTSSPGEGSRFYVTLRAAGSARHAGELDRVAG